MGQHQDAEADSQGPSHDRKLTWRLCFTSSASESGLPAISLLRWPTGPGQADRPIVQALKVEKDAPCTPGWRLAAASSQMKCCYRFSIFKHLAGTVSFGSQLSSVTGLIIQRSKCGSILLPPSVGQGSLKGAWLWCVGPWDREFLLGGCPGSGKTEPIWGRPRGPQDACRLPTSLISILP